MDFWSIFAICGIGILSYIFWKIYRAIFLIFKMTKDVMNAIDEFNYKKIIEMSK